MLIFDLDDQVHICIQGQLGCVFEPKASLTSRHSTNLKVHLSTELDKVAFDTISLK